MEPERPLLPLAEAVQCFQQLQRDRDAIFGCVDLVERHRRLSRLIRQLHSLDFNIRALHSHATGDSELQSRIAAFYREYQDEMRLICQHNSRLNSHRELYAIQRILKDTIFGALGRAVHLPTGMSVAIKISIRRRLAVEHMEDPFQEIAYLRHLEERGGHASVVRHLADFEVDDEKSYFQQGAEHWIVLEFIQGVELFDYVSSGFCRSEDEARHLFRDMCAGLRFVHSCSVAHHDVSLENFMVALDASNRPTAVKLIDFGLARRIPPTGLHEERPCGKFSYTLPDRYSGRPYNLITSDLFSLGVSLFMMIAHQRPFHFPQDVDPGYVLLALGRVDERLRELGVNASAEVIDLLNRLLGPEAQRVSWDDIVNHPWLKH